MIDQFMCYTCTYTVYTYVKKTCRLKWIVLQETPGDAARDQPERTLRRLRRLDPSQIPTLDQQDPIPPKTRQEPTKVKKNRRKRVELVEDPDYMAEIEALAAQAEPPVYSTQGADVGKTRGRKSKAAKEPKGSMGEGRSGKNRTKKGRQQGGKNKRSKTKGSKRKQKQLEDSNTECGKPAVGKFKKLRTMTRSSKLSPVKPAAQEQEPPAVEGQEPPPVQDDEEPVGVPFHVGPKRAPPPHVTANIVYSSAYRRNIGMGPEYARLAGQMAASMFRSTGFVDDLCGVFRSKPRKNASPDENNWSRWVWILTWGVLPRHAYLGSMTTWTTGATKTPSCSYHIGMIFKILYDRISMFFQKRKASYGSQK